MPESPIPAHHPAQGGATRGGSSLFSCPRDARLASFPIRDPSAEGPSPLGGVVGGDGGGTGGGGHCHGAADAGASLAPGKLVHETSKIPTTKSVLSSMTPTPLTYRARILRARMTDAERFLWRTLREQAFGRK